MSIPTTLINAITYNISDAITWLLYSSAKEEPNPLLTPVKPKSASAADDANPAEEPKKKPRRRRIKFSAGLQKKQESELLTNLMAEKKDIYRLTGVKPDEMDKPHDAYKRMMHIFAPDKFELIFKPVLAEARAAADQDTFLSKTKDRITAKTFFELTGITAETKDEELEKIQEATFTKIKEYDALLVDQELRKDYREWHQKQGFFKQPAASGGSPTA